MNAIYSETLNHGRFETWTSKPEFSIAHVHQVHGVEIVKSEELPCEADGLISTWENLSEPFAIKTADCLPMVIEGERGIVFLHAGWRGLANGILANDKIKSIKPKNIFIGPSINVCCFEVSEDFKDNFKGSPNFQARENKLFFNLQEEAKLHCFNLFPGIEVRLSDECTCCNEIFHSYRRNKTTLRNWNIYIKG